MKPAVVFTCVLLCLLGATTARAATRQATIGNYYYEDDEQRDRSKIVVRQGDQITFTVRAAAYPPHTVDVDALNIHSPDLLIGETYTTPALNKAGTYFLYCRPHEARGHHTQLVVSAAPKPTPAPATAPPPPPPPGSVATPAPTAAAATPTPIPTATLTPVGIATSSPGSVPRSNPNSLEALTGRRTSASQPWTRSLWWLLIASVPIVGAALFALRREAVRVPVVDTPPRKRKPPARKSKR